ncbi:glycosyltransferase family protein [Halorarum salinum]|uniref:Glycosyl transferase family 2 n=1 Tax=Halorarum salinum TaxID=2743089 RepID=A0A7D5LCG4_9EURY|nr:glycosyl transferase family 2 [Halobaculum salinum]QLG63274.1 glycosyl transferase family 2 [Halobaculum salinum]
MEYVQERVATLHDFREDARDAAAAPPAPVDRAAVVVPMTEREYEGLAAERVLAELEALAPARVVVPLRASPERVGDVRAWLEGFDLPLEVVWCDGPRLGELLADEGVNGERGKGRDVWLALGRALEEEYVVLHDADTTSYSRAYVRRLLFPLAHGFDFSKGYYARVEDGKLYGRLFRLFYAPLVRALRDAHADPLLAYLDSFRYALAGEFATTSEVAASLRVQRGWGLEVGTLADAFRAVGFEGSAQVDLGSYAHDHRAVSGPTGLSDMSRSVGAALLRAVEERGVEPDYATLPDRYREAAGSFLRAYAADAAFNGFEYDLEDERAQVHTYADAVGPPGEDTRLPPWRDAPVDRDEAFDAAAEDLTAAAEGGVSTDSDA